MSSPEQESLRELLLRVHERLSGAEKVEAEAREWLVALTHDIERALAAERSRPAGADTRMPRLEALAIKFEASHPALAQTLWELIDALGKAGI
jgi:hypothetical protein